jgi:ATP-dependent RNA helicase DDX56/DBP9
VRLFLSQFGIRSVVLNSELPVNERIRVVEEFNRNVYDILVASDEQDFAEEPLGSTDKFKSASGKSHDMNTNTTLIHGNNVEEMDPEAGNKMLPTKRRKPNKKDKEYGISRGIDFQNVACIVNFDLPTSPYVAMSSAGLIDD